MNTTEPTVRVATSSDAPAISSLLYKFSGEAPSPEVLAERLVLARERETVFLAELEGKLAGLLVLGTAPTRSAVRDSAEVTELYVPPASRRRGIGKALVQAAIQHARRYGCTAVHLLVDPKNSVARTFYKAAGFCGDSWEMRRKV